MVHYALNIVFGVDPIAIYVNVTVSCVQLVGRLELNLQGHSIGA